MKVVLPFFLVVACLGPARAQTPSQAPAGENPLATTRTMASLLAEGYERQTVQIFKDKIWMRKENVGGIAYICDRGQLGTAAFEAYREKKYEQITCSLVQ